MTGQKGRSGGARPGSGRHLVSVYRVIIEQVADQQAALSRLNKEVHVQFPDEERPIPLKDLAYSQEIGLYDKRRFPNLEESNLYIIKASHSGPQWVQIGPGSNPIDLKNHMHLSDKQEQAYQQALLLAKQGNVDSAADVLRPVFEKVWIER